VDLHRLAEERSIAYHRAIATRLREDPALLARVRARVAQWIARGDPHPAYGREWDRILKLPIDGIVAALVDPSERARALRQVTPFAGALSPRERWAIGREVARAHGFA
jgi:hypothetical protein